MALLTRLLLGLIAVGMQSPARISVPLCLCDMLPFTCSQEAGCGEDEAPASCCSNALTDREGGGEGEGPAHADDAPLGCCECAVDVGGTGPAPRGAVASPLVDVSWLGNALVLTTPPTGVIVASPRVEPPPPRAAPAQGHRQLRI